MSIKAFGKPPAMVSSLNASIPNIKETAINKPPATTSGSICDTPVIKCLYTPFFSSVLVSVAALVAAPSNTFASLNDFSNSCAVFFNAKPVEVRYINLPLNLSNGTSISAATKTRSAAATSSGVIGLPAPT